MSRKCTSALRTIRLHANDNVAVAVEDLSAGDMVSGIVVKGRTRAKIEVTNHRGETVAAAKHF
jgi:hypothetical protein